MFDLLSLVRGKLLGKFALLPLEEEEVTSSLLQLHLCKGVHRVFLPQQPTTIPWSGTGTLVYVCGLRRFFLGDSPAWCCLRCNLRALHSSKYRGSGPSWGSVGGGGGNKGLLVGTCGATAGTPALPFNRIRSKEEGLGILCSGGSPAHPARKIEPCQSNGGSVSSMHAHTGRQDWRKGDVPGGPCRTENKNTRMDGGQRMSPIFPMLRTSSFTEQCSVANKSEDGLPEHP